MDQWVSGPWPRAKVRPGKGLTAGAVYSLTYSVLTVGAHFVAWAPCDGIPKRLSAERRRT